MNSKEKEVISKLIKIAEKQQKILEKLAQNKIHPEISMEQIKDEEEHGYHEKDPFYSSEKPLGQGDPLWMDPKMQVDYSKSPAKTPNVSGKMEPVQPNAVPGSALPADLKAAIDKGAPGLKGSLVLTVHGGNVVDVKYNGTRVTGGVPSVKMLLQKALGNAYVVGDVLAVNNPDLKAWAVLPNYY